MSIQHTSRVIIKGIWRDMITFWRYRAQVWGLLLESGMILFGFLVFSGAYYFNDAALKYTGLSENDIFLFMCAGATLQTFIGISVKAP